MLPTNQALQKPSILRDYQALVKHAIMGHIGRGNCKAVAAVLPTGSGKTVIMADIFSDIKAPSVAIAHRQELVGQISMAMARAGVVHKIIAPPEIIKFIVSEHIRVLGQKFYDAKSIHAVAGVDTLIKHQDSHREWANQVQLWEIDEAHHVLENNKWGKAVKLFPNARGIGWTATPLRADRKALKSGKGGVFEELVIGPTMRDLIDRGHLADYRIFGPPASIDLSTVRVTASGDFDPNQLRAASKKSTIVGDVVAHYKRLALGKLGVTFAVDVDDANEIATEFNNNGIPAAAISAKTPAGERARLIGKFANREIIQLVNVDIFGEGFDCPAIEVVSMARPTESYSLFVQQFGRALRPLPGKTHGIIIDHVDNVRRHANKYGLPDQPPQWTLDAPPKKERKKDEPDAIKICIQCWQPFEPFKRACPHCGYRSEPGRRDKPEFVEGDLTELDPAALASIMKRSQDIMEPFNLNPQASLKARITHANYHNRMDAQRLLRDTIAVWSGYHKYHLKIDRSEETRLFYRQFGIDMANATTLGARDADELMRRVQQHVVETRMKNDEKFRESINDAENLLKLGMR